MGIVRTQSNINIGNFGGGTPYAINTCPFLNPTASENLIVVGVSGPSGQPGSGPATASITDTAGNTYVLAASATLSNSSHVPFNVTYGHAIWYCKDALPNAGTVTCSGWTGQFTGSGFSTSVMYIHEYGGIDPVSPLVTAVSPGSVSALGFGGFVSSGLVVGLTQVNTGGAGVYTGAATGGDNNAYAGRLIQFAGFTNSNNNGTWFCVSSNATTITVIPDFAATGSWVFESHVGTATIGADANWSGNGSGATLTNSYGQLIYQLSDQGFITTGFGSSSGANIANGAYTYSSGSAGLGLYFYEADNLQTPVTGPNTLYAWNVACAAVFRPCLQPSMIQFGLGF